MSEDDSSAEASRSDAESEPSPMEWNVNSRQRRTTAGNRLSTLLQQEEAKDDEVELLFVEDEAEPDEDFDIPASAAGSDVEPNDEGGSSDSSSSSEDEGGADEDLAGEKQLEKEERQAKRRNKRKADAALVKPRSTKRVKIVEPSTANSTGHQRQPATHTPRPRKKSERVSWILAEDKAQRTSSRTLSMQNKERTQASLREAETRRIKQMAISEASQKKKDASKVKPMNQAERMAEAARTERANAKSLNRWEEMERDRVAKQKAKLDALQNRVLEGPVIRWWSGRADWVDGKCVRTGKGKMIEEVSNTPAKAKKEAKAKKGSPDSAVTSTVGVKGQSPAGSSSDINATPKEGSPLQPQQKAPNDAPESMDIDKAGTSTAALLAPQLHTQISADPTLQKQQPSFLDGIEAYAAHPEEATRPPTATSAPLEEPPTITAQLQEDIKNNDLKAGSSPAPSQPMPPQQGQAQASSVPSPKPQHKPHPLDVIHAPPPPSSPLLSQPPTPQLQGPTTHSAHQSLTLLNYPSHTLAPTPTGLDIRRRIIFALPAGSRSLKPQKPPQTLCAATGQLARYWDPRLGVGYRDLEAGRRLRGLVGGLGETMDRLGSRERTGVQGEKRAVWSAVLGAWVSGRKGVAGVPPGFDGEAVVEETGVGGEAGGLKPDAEDVKSGVAAS